NWFKPLDRTDLEAKLVSIRSSLNTILTNLGSYTTPNHTPANEIEEQVNRWFGNRAALNATQIAKVRQVFRQVRDGLNNNRTVFWDDSFEISYWGQVNWRWFSGRYGTIQLGAIY